MLSTPQATRRLIKEITRLKSEPPEGIRVSTSEESLLDVTGIIAGPGELHIRWMVMSFWRLRNLVSLAGTPYEGGYFRVQFVFTEEFPAVPPRCMCCGYLAPRSFANPQLSKVVC